MKRGAVLLSNQCACVLFLLDDPLAVICCIYKVIVATIQRNS